MKLISYTITILLLLLHPHPSHSHNGAVAIAVPVEGITVDGDLSDWPEGMREYEIALPEYGDKPVDEEDLQGSVRIGYSEEENALYIAVEVRDESVVAKYSGDWDTQDGCEVYLDIEHGEKDTPAIQYVLYGNEPAGGFFGVKVKRTERLHQYEWRIDLGEKAVQLIPGVSIGFDVAICDRDENGSFTWMTWGKDLQKVDFTDRRGDLLLVKEGTKHGLIRGQLQWKGGSTAIKHARVRIQSISSDLLWLDLRTDQQGIFSAEVPVGEYTVESEIGRENKDKVAVKVKEAKVTEAILLVPSTSGFSIRAGSGRIVKAGAGFLRESWQTFSTPDGLLSSEIHAIYQDRKGNLWYGTRRGASRYDGIYFTNFSPEDGLAGNDVVSIFQDRKGNLWFGTTDGVSRYDGAQFTTFTTEDGLASDVVLSIMEDQQGNLWFGTTRGVNRFDGQHFSLFTTEDGLAADAVSSILEDRHGNLWFSTAGGVSRYDGETFTTFTTEDGLTHNAVWSISEDNSGNLWFGTIDGVSRYDGAQFTTFTTEDGLPAHEVTCILEDWQGNLWFGTSGGGVTRYDGKRVANFTTEDGLANRWVYSGLKDQAGNLWFGTAAGVSRYNVGQITSFTAGDGLADSHVFSMVEDQAGNLWFGTASGVSRYDGQNFITFTTEDGLASDVVHSIMEDQQGNLWFGTTRGVNRFDGQHFSLFTTEGGLAGNDVLSIFQDRQGYLWFGSADGGVSRYDGQSFITFTTEDGLASDVVLSIMEDQQGNLWFGTTRGVNRFDGQHFSLFTTEAGLAANRVSSMLEDRQGNMWFCTAGSGVNRYDGKRFTTYTPEDGLANSWVVSSKMDQKGHLWFGSEEGVSRYDGFVFQSLHMRDGLVDNLVTDILEDRRGNIWIATEGGVTRYRPSHISPPILLSDVLLDRRYGSVDEIRFPSSQKYIAFEFRATSFNNRPGQMIYLYRLEGIEGNWRQTKEGQVEYTDLPIGEYTFEVKAVDRDLNYSEEPATVKVIVHPPYGQIALWSGIGLSLIGLIIASGYGVKRQRERNQAQEERDQAREQLVQHLEEQNREIEENTRRKSEFLASMSHEIRTPMNAIIGYTRILLRRLRDTIEPRQLRNLENIDTSAHNLLNLINEILDLSKVESGRIDIRPQTVDLQQLAVECTAAIEPLIKAEVQLNHDIEAVPSLRTDGEILRKVLMNLLGNAVKFTDTGSITVSVKPVDDQVEVSVADTGMGIPSEDLPYIFEEFRQVERQGSTEKEGTGLGLAIARKSVELLGGMLSAASEVGKGTKFSLRIKDFPSE